MRVLVTGVNGQLGYDVVKELNQRNHEPVGVGKGQMDLTDFSQIKECIEKVKPNAIIHCAAYTSVDEAEDNEDLCRRVNALAVKGIANCAKQLDIPMIYISTDYVFNGRKSVIFDSKSENLYIDYNNIEIDKYKYIEYKEDDIPDPINVYGKTKLEGENYVKDILKDKFYIVRISWVFGQNGNNFIDTMLKLSKNRNELNIIDDQVGSPTYTKDLSRLLVDMVETDKYGIYHATNQGVCSWYDFAKEIFRVANVDIKLNPITTDQYKTKAKRPLNSKLDQGKLVKNGFKPLGKWQDAVKDYLRNA